MNRWITSGADHSLTVWVIDILQKEYIFEVKQFQAHNNLIMAVIEVTLSNLVASCSLDGTINIWNLYDHQHITKLEDALAISKDAQRGFKSLSYTKDFGGNLLSIGFNNYINVWSPDSSISQSFVGRLEGHSSIVVAVKFIPGSPNCISVDDKFNIRVWDIRSFMTIQMIRDESMSLNSVVTCMEVIPRLDKFVVGGKRLQMYNNDLMRKNLKSFNEELNPIKACFNFYLKTVMIQTKIDIRVYDAYSGKLVKVFNDLQDEKIQGDLTQMILDSRQRKIIIGDNVGLIRQYNANNGEAISKVVQFKDLREFIKKNQ
jgi:WD40 repeat protein